MSAPFPPSLLVSLCDMQGCRAHLSTRPPSASRILLLPVSDYRMVGIEPGVQGGVVGTWALRAYGLAHPDSPSSPLKPHSYIPVSCEEYSKEPRLQSKNLTCNVSSPIFKAGSEVSVGAWKRPGTGVGGWAGCLGHSLAGEGLLTQRERCVRCPLAGGRIQDALGAGILRGPALHNPTVPLCVRETPGPEFSQFAPAYRRRDRAAP